MTPLRKEDLPPFSYSLQEGEQCRFSKGTRVQLKFSWKWQMTEASLGSGSRDMINRDWVELLCSSASPENYFGDNLGGHVKVDTHMRLTPVEWECLCCTQGDERHRGHWFTCGGNVVHFLKNGIWFWLPLATTGNSARASLGVVIFREQRKRIYSTAINCGSRITRYGKQL